MKNLISRLRVWYITPLMSEKTGTVISVVTLIVTMSMVMLLNYSLLGGEITLNDLKGDLK